MSRKIPIRYSNSNLELSNIFEKILMYSIKKSQKNCQEIFSFCQGISRLSSGIRRLNVNIQKFDVIKDNLLFCNEITYWIVILKNLLYYVLI